MKTILITGGAGYVGSHCCKAFAKAGWSVVTFDNLSRGWKDAVKWGPFFQGDVTDRMDVAAALACYRPDVVAHFAAYAYVAESVERPDIYYRNNSFGTLTFLEEMRLAEIDKLIFSSTCATYGVPIRTPIDEGHPQSPINPYGWSKFIIERMIEQFAAAYKLNSVILRYFNAAGCDPDGEIGERHLPETHVVPVAIAAALGQLPFQINGTHFSTRDGTAIRDYVHVSDLARAHVAAADKLLADTGVHTYNLGTGVGITIAEIIETVRRVTGEHFPIINGPPRPGDPPVLVAAADKARRELGWLPEVSDIDRIVETAASWLRQKPRDQNEIGVMASRRRPAL